MKRALIIVALAALAAGILVVGGNAAGIARPSSKVLHISTKTLLLTGPTTAPAPGDHYEFYESASGGDRGKDYYECVVTNHRGATFCDGQFVLRHGDISIQGVFPSINATTVHVSGPITGGTGRYSGAKGTFLATGTPTSTHLAFHLAP